MAIPEGYDGQRTGWDSPCANAEVITPDDSNDLSINTRAVWVGGAGNLNVDMVGAKGSTTVLFSGITAGTVLPIQVKRIRSTSTTATLIVAMW